MARARAAKEIKAKRTSLIGENMAAESRESETKGVGATEAWGKRKTIPEVFYRVFSRRDYLTTIIYRSTGRHKARIKAG
jgi:hypothetical protein